MVAAVRVHKPGGPEVLTYEDVNVGGIYMWVAEFGLKAVKQYGESVKKYPNPPAPNLTRFTGK